MRITLIAATALVAGVLGGQSAHAGLAGDSVDVAYYFGGTDPTSLYQDDGASTVPIASDELLSGTPNTFVSVSDSQVTVTFDSVGIYAPSPFNGVILTDETTSDIMGVSIDGATSSELGFTTSDLSFTDDSISINLQSLDVPTASDEIVLDISTTAPVPEPMGLSVLATGLIGLGVARRRKVF